ncbi:hypothetical protein RHAL1_04010 [Beijerinckiaceae bacterium RH AL1]|nr:hypothetical protein [Beijerinckiaceae bacterium]VVB49781.1 hypothetical protein RHCH11_RHCH11_03936 [Beijerinckiaceae bacterium RH CH11]VVB49858.1 hypothetical protein RHAL8_03932 [Beijerinckiaceae bacterium RH AL8]VVC57073.1 hypothetical protein RHAL1_04010 [Beijerinckiaceae bacterium RH AL1]
MSQSLQVAGYDKRTERLSVCLPVPATLFETARSLASVGADDDGGGSYPLEPQAAVSLGLKMKQGLNPDLYDWFLEPRGD